MPQEDFDVAIIGGGASGAALLYVLAKYTNIGKVTLIEKYSTLGSVNSDAKNNSQTLHVGDIESNYSIEKVKEVYPAAMMVKQYTDMLPKHTRDQLIRVVQKMVLAVGKEEVQILEERYPKLKEMFPTLQRLDGAGIAEVEPEVMRGRKKDELVLALFNPDGYAVDFGALAQNFGHEAKKVGGERITLLLNTSVEKIKPHQDGYILTTGSASIRAKLVIVDADAYSLGFAKQLGYGKEFSLIPIAGTFFFTPEKLRGKVYRVQDSRMPFAAVHGDPDLTKGDVTRWGPTARFYPVLEARKLTTVVPFFASSGMHRIQTWFSFFVILLEPIRFWYLLKNFFYDLPFIGKHIFLPQVRKIVPTLKAVELRSAIDYGGMRLQRVDTNTRQLLLGEGKIIGKNIIFNMTPSPGASVSLYNAMRDAEQIMKFKPEYVFEKGQMSKDLCVTHASLTGTDVSLRESYAS